MVNSILRPAACLLAFGLFIVAGGCEPTPLDEDPPAKAAEPISATPESPATKVLEKSWSEVRQEIAALKDRVVVVNIWTTTCARCLAEFPDFAALTRQWPEDEVVFYDVNCDYDGIEDKPIGYYRPKLLKALEEHKGTSQHVALTDPFIDFLDQNDIRSTPTVLVYDRAGELVKQFDNSKEHKEDDEFHMDDVAALVEQLLAKQP